MTDEQGLNSAGVSGAALHIGINVGWAITRHHNIIAAAKILDREADLLQEAGLGEGAAIARNVCHELRAMAIRDIECIPLKLESEDERRERREYPK